MVVVEIAAVDISNKTDRADHTYCLTCDENRWQVHIVELNVRERERERDFSRSNSLEAAVKLKCGID